MIEIRNCSKAFGKVQAVNQVSMDIGEHEVFGLIGSNGAGKSTLLRIMAGIICQDSGEVLLDEQPVFENEKIKEQFFYIPDDAYIPANYTASDMTEYYRCFYPGFRQEQFEKLIKQFHLDKKRKISTFSKGMKKQLLVILGICAGTKYLYCDETFDGLDPIARNIAKRLIYRDMCDFGSTVILTSHSLRELEDTCDRFAMLYQGKIVFQNDLADAKSQLFKVQLAFARQVTPEDFKDVELLSFTKQGSIVYVLVRGEAAETSAKIEALKPLIMDMLPLSIEEVFTYELSSLGYNFDEIK